MGLDAVAIKEDILNAFSPIAKSLPLLVIILGFFAITGILIFGFINFQKKLKHRAYVLYFYGKDDCEIVKIDDRKLDAVLIGEGIHDLSKTSPKNLKINSFLGSGKYPLYKVKKELVSGLDIYSPDYVEMAEEGKKAEIYKIKDIPAKLEPKVVRAMIESKIYKDFAKSSLDTGFNWLNFLLGVGAGVIGYLLVTGMNII